MLPPLSFSTSLYVVSHDGDDDDDDVDDDDDDDDDDNWSFLQSSKRLLPPSQINPILHASRMKMKGKICFTCLQPYKVQTPKRQNSNFYAFCEILLIKALFFPAKYPFLHLFVDFAKKALILLMSKDWNLTPTPKPVHTYSPTPLGNGHTSA